MRHICFLGLTLILAAPLPAAAESQSSNSSSNCSNGRCSRVETYVEERRGYRWGERREERWRERSSQPFWTREEVYRQASPRAWRGPATRRRPALAQPAQR